ncbi:Rhomboid protease GluP [Enhygromyxa salina]|uniref:Rhomboid protease GluP n=1 Tax=Enhygromyxa salina TaxID=215803 RepID=A0A2S9XPE0_9BACT|nr:rhomboid family intramembrane serine protease [Enhygromyxa salina]PRP94723.1 Rhomboid protease GluP [Enhygromyxa salina]
MSEQEFEGEVVSLAERRAQAQAREAEARRQQALQQARVEAGEEPKPWLTYVLIGLNVLVWVVMVSLGVDAYEPSGGIMVDYGALVGVLIVNGEWWRLLTAMFLHAGIFHIGFNMYFLWQVGRFCERLFGRPGYLTIYLGTGLLAGMVSAAWTPTIPSVGASGALFGLFGAFLGFTLRRRRSLPPEFVRMAKMNALILGVLSVVIAVMIPRIDLVAHVVGFVVGLGLGYLISKLAERPVKSKQEARALQLKVVAGVAAATAVVLVAGALGLPRWDDPYPKIEAAYDRYHAVELAYIAAGEDVERRIEVIEEQALPVMDQNQAELGAAMKLPARSRETVDQWTRHYDLRGQAFAKELEGLRNNDPRAISEAEALHAEAMAALGDESE